MNLSDPGLPRGPIVESFREQLAAQHEKGKKADQTLRDAILDKLRVTREAGILLEEARGTLRHKEFAEATAFLGEDAVQAYLKFNRVCPDPIDDVAHGIRAIAIAMMASGALEFPHGHGPQQLHKLTFTSEAVRSVQIFAAGWAKYVNRKPLADWRDDEITAFLGTLAPILAIYRALQAEAQKRAGQQSL